MSEEKPFQTENLRNTKAKMSLFMYSKEELGTRYTEQSEQGGKDEVER